MCAIVVDSKWMRSEQATKRVCERVWAYVFVYLSWMAYLDSGHTIQSLTIGLIHFNTIITIIDNALIFLIYMAIERERLAERETAGVLHICEDRPGRL